MPVRLTDYGNAAKFMKENTNQPLLVILRPCNCYLMQAKHCLT